MSKHINFNLGESIWRYPPWRPYLKVHFEIGPSGALSQNTLTELKIWAHNANIPVHCLWIDTPCAYVWTLIF